MRRTIPKWVLERGGLQLTVGEEILITDDQGRTCDAMVQEVGQDSYVIQIAPPSKRSLTLDLREVSKLIAERREQRVKAIVQHVADRPHMVVDTLSEVLESLDEVTRKLKHIRESLVAHGARDIHIDTLDNFVSAASQRIDRLFHPFQPEPTRGPALRIPQEDT